MTEKRHRRTQAEVEQLVAKVRQLVQTGTAATTACEQLGLTYQTYMRHKAGSGSSPKGSSGKVQKLLSQLIEAIREEVRAEIKASL